MPKFMPSSLTPSQFANLCPHLNSQTLRASPMRSSSVTDIPVTSEADDYLHTLRSQWTTTVTKICFLSFQRNNSCVCFQTFWDSNLDEVTTCLIRAAQIQLWNKHFVHNPNHSEWGWGGGVGCTLWQESVHGRSHMGHTSKHTTTYSHDPTNSQAL